ncbi:hypothetical protein GALMADRAFT_1183451 [Galerina marginata CBS 339.88]|uniref:Uncharacterized protein n=1 Tax=Galerina marginata (strain CBS 339.88) TaxID=685588 RepID=A0A067TMI7_GALM3|nr:hypothetical protein GALMADRAFT_1183451 [Galerina marginata CBS 339.88]
MDQDVDTNTTTPWVQMNQHAQQPVHQPAMQSFGQAGTWVQTHNRARLLQEQGHYDPNAFHRAEPPSFQQQAPATFCSQQACTPHSQPSVDHAAEQFERATNVWLSWISSSVSDRETSFMSSPASTSHTAPPPPTQSQPEEPAMTHDEAESERRFWDLVRRAEDEASERGRNPFNYAAAVARGPSATAYLSRSVPEVSAHSSRPIRSLPGRADPRQRQVADGPLGSEANLQYRLVSSLSLFFPW